MGMGPASHAWSSTIGVTATTDGCKRKAAGSRLRKPAALRSPLSALRSIPVMLPVRNAARARRSGPLSGQDAAHQEPRAPVQEHRRTLLVQQPGRIGFVADVVALVL